MDRRRSELEYRRLLAWTLVVCCLLGGRALLTGRVSYSFLAWNLFLAWIPYGLSRWIGSLATRTRPGTGVLVLPTALWLLFFPNAPYIVTDFIHLRWAAPACRAFDAVLIASFAALGLALGLLSLRRVHRVVQDRLGSKVGWGFVATVLLLSGAGIWMGRVLRWNSWDVVTNPMGIVRTTSRALLDPWNHLSAVGFTLACAGSLAVLYGGLARLTRSRSGMR